MTKIEWTDETWNPVVGCSITSPGCKNCYAMELANRLLDRAGSHYEGTTERVNGNPVWTGKVENAPQHILETPLHWKKPRRIFVNSMGDLFHEDVPIGWIEWVFAVILLCPQHTFQILTKRADRMRRTISALQSSDINDICGTMMHWDDMPCRNDWPLNNVWFGVSVEDQKHAEERIPDLLATPAAVRFISAEPLIGPVDLEGICNGFYFLDALSGVKYHDAPGAKTERTPSLDWLICGGESGRGHRPIDAEWARSLRNQCGRAGVPFFFKQWGGNTPKAGGRLLDGREWNEFPAAASRVHATPQDAQQGLGL
ncbi:MAG: phage Gp37/Gp68 family protein [Rhodobacteraceae bacterium]|nr:phage Gp37/Gp68 family protein [Paracoccaceae bacterium]